MAVDLSKLTAATPDPEEEEKAMQEIPVEEDLAEYVFLLGVDLLEEGGGMSTLQKAVQQSGDPILVISQFIVQMVAQLSEVLSKETNFDPRVMLVRGGFVDSISDYIVEKLALGEEASDMIEQEVLEMIKGLAQGGKKSPPPGAGQGAPMEQAAASGGGMAQPMGNSGFGLDSIQGGM